MRESTSTPEGHGGASGADAALRLHQVHQSALVCTSEPLWCWWTAVLSYDLSRAARELDTGSVAGRSQTLAVPDTGSPMLS